MNKKDLDRFLNKINIKSKTECWVWNGGKSNYGYGHFWYNGKTYGAHRMSYRIHNKNFPKKLFILHSCDNPSCVNPSHLFTGTHIENMRDRERKGRGDAAKRIGERNPVHKLKDSEVKDIIKKYSSNMSQTKIAKIFKINQCHVSRIINKLRRKNVTT